MAEQLDYLAAIGRESARFVECLEGADPAGQVPSCPGWTAADLLWHLTEVQMFWGIIVRGRLDDPDAAEAEKAARPDDHDALVALARRTTVELLDTLGATPAGTPVWTWAADHTAGFVLRRQAHEALIHRLDAELTVGHVTPLDPPLAADGVDEALRIMFSNAPDWGTVTDEGGLGVVAAADVAMSWPVELGRFRGTSPNTGKTYDEGLLLMPSRPDAPAMFAVAGTAADLDRWLWGRGELSELDVSGDETALEMFVATIAAGVQ